MLDLELAASCTSLVGAETFDGLGAFLLVEKAGRRNIVVEFPVDEGTGDDGHKTDKEEDATRDRQQGIECG